MVHLGIKVSIGISYFLTFLLHVDNLRVRSFNEVQESVSRKEKMYLSITYGRVVGTTLQFFHLDL